MVFSVFFVPIYLILSFLFCLIFLNLFSFHFFLSSSLPFNFLFIRFISFVCLLAFFLLNFFSCLFFFLSVHFFPAFAQKTSEILGEKSFCCLLMAALGHLGCYKISLCLQVDSQSTSSPNYFLAVPYSLRSCMQTVGLEDSTLGKMPAACVTLSHSEGV